MGILNSLGYQTTTYQDIWNAIADIFKTVFGADINLSLYSPQGQLITFIATLFDNEEKLGLNFFQAYDYHNASGMLLSFIAITKGQPRRDGTIATLTATFTSSDINYTIPTIS